MFEFDICLCGNNEKCPDKDKCLRAIKRTGICTVSDFYSIREKYKCKYFIEKGADKKC